MGRVILNLLEPTSGEVIFEKVNIFQLDKENMRRIRCNMQIIFQDPFGSLNPRMTVGDIIGEVLLVHRVVKRKREVEEKIIDLLKTVGLQASHIRRYPHQFSGGQRQRIGIARALALNPKFVICDEPVSALDVSIQAQILNLLEELQKKFQLTYLFIAHDLSVVKHISDRVAVMYLGKIVELTDTIQLYNQPLHPYTKALLSAVPVPDITRQKKKRIILEGDVPSPFKPPVGCRFHPRCKYSIPICCQKEPKLIDIGKEHYIACHL